MPKPDYIAFDRSARTTDADGRLHVERSHISKAAINPYYGSEIPGWEQLGLVGTQVYRLLRDPVELERAASTFARLPILSKHQPVTVEKPKPELVIGAIGSNVAFDSPYLDADLCFWDAKAIGGIETDQVTELSCAYRYVPVMEPGEYEGQPYDGRMTDIRGNHLALVEVGRAGSDVVVADHNPFKEPCAMKFTKLGKALFAALSAASPVLAQDSALPGLVASANRKTFKKDEVKAQLIALDASIDSTKLDSVLDAILDVEQSPDPVEKPVTAGDESPADKLRALLAGKVDDATMEAACALLGTPAAADADPEDKTDEKVEAAMDSFRKELREAAEACREVRPTVGEVIGMDSAANVYAFALDHMKVDRKGVEGAAALRALYRVAADKPVIAQDANCVKEPSLTDRFPGMARFTK